MTGQCLDDEEIRQMLFDIPSDYDDDTEEEDIQDDESTIILDDSCLIYNLPIVDENSNDEMTMTVNAEDEESTHGTKTGNKLEQSKVPRKLSRKPEPAYDISFQHHEYKK